MKKKCFIPFITSILLIPNVIAITNQSEIHATFPDCSINSDETEYWALIVGVESGNPNTDNWMTISAKNMYECLLSSENWDEDHIKLITDRKATKLNIIRGLCWLDRMEDENDVSLVYFSTHGGPLSTFGRFVDLPPKDETDNRDEALETWHSLHFHMIPLIKKFPIAALTDDELNSFLSRLESQRVCVVIDSCYAGGFNDAPYTSMIDSDIILSTDKNRDSSAKDFMKDFSEELGHDGRVILMGTKEDEECGGNEQGGFFTNALIEYLQQGLGDFNNNGFISAEEAFIYTKPRVDCQYSQTPTIYDGYAGEIPLVISKYTVDFFDDAESGNDEWTTIDHTGGTGDDLWHVSEIDATTTTHCWHLGDEVTRRYHNDMNNSLVSTEIELGEKPFLTFFANVAIETYDSLYLETSTDNWDTYQTKKLEMEHSNNWRPVNISLHSLFGDLSGETIQMRFRFRSDENIPFDLISGKGHIMIDDIIIYGKRIGA